MTGRTCPVHGEYSETGVCRWCESKPVTFLDVALSSPNARLVPALEPTPWIRSLGPALHVERTEAAIDAETHAEEESRLLAQHAALRWERVARRWNYKHRRAGGLDEEGPAYVWRCWLEKQQRIFDDRDWLRDQKRLLKTIYEGHKMDPDGGLAFDDHCASCVRLAREGRWP